MRYDTERKARSRALILEAAARQIRGRGPSSVAVAEVMAEAGLTHGAFYAHFPSKEALVAEAVETMFETAKGESRAKAEALADETADPRAFLRAYLTGYLSSRHRDGAERGCPLPALAADMARSDGPARQRFSEGIGRMTARIEASLTRIGHKSPAAEANAVVAQMVGAVALSRAVSTGPEADGFLRDNLDALVMRLAL